MSNSKRRFVVGIAAPVAACGLTVGAAWWGAGRLPDPMASHWNLRGRPDGSMAIVVAYLISIGLVVLAGMAAFVVSRRRDPAPLELAPPIAIAAFFQWLFAGVMVASVVANLDAASWRDARHLALPAALAVPAMAIGAAATMADLIRPLEHGCSVRRRNAATVGKGPSERLVWFGRVTSRWWVLVGGTLMVVGLGMLVVQGPASAIWPVMLGGLVASFASVRVVADQRGLTVRYGLLPWPATRIDLDDIQHAQAIDVRPMKHGGWGYRGSLRVFGRAAVVVRAGQGLRLDLRRGRTFVVTVDDAATGAGTINDLLPA